MDRRHFLSLSALTGYSVFVDARGLFGSPSSAASSSLETVSASGVATGALPAAEPNMTLVEKECDFLVAGGGMAGVCAALSAARHGARVILIQDRSRLGGNASSEVKMHIVGADQHGSRAGWREGGLIEEFRLEDAVHNPHRAWELWDLMLYDKVISNPNITLLLDTAVYGASVNAGRIEHVMARSDKTEHLYRIRAKLYADCTGDSRLALESGAEYRWGRESKAEFGESLAVDTPDRKTQGSSILFTSRLHDRPIGFTPPSWARKITKDHLKFRGIGSWEYGYWWIELGGMYDTIKDNERIRFELLSVVLGVWDYIKNSGEHPDSANWALQTVGMIPGKRESRRVTGDHILTQGDLEGGWKSLPDGVAIGGWAMDDHPPEGFDDPDQAPFRSVKLPEPYNIPLGSLYSRSLSNLLMAGRNLSASHVGFTSARVMATTSVMGQAVGTAAALCLRDGVAPRVLRNDPARVAELQQVLLRDDQTIRSVRNEDPADLARTARVTASASLASTPPDRVLTGEVRDLPELSEAGLGPRPTDDPSRALHRWVAPMTPGGPALELTWGAPQRIGLIQITFDTGFHRQLTLTASDSHTNKIVRGPQPETVKDYTLQVRENGRWATVAEVSGNYQRLCRHAFDPVLADAVRLHVKATNGADEARVYEIRCYGETPRLLA